MIPDGPFAEMCHVGFDEFPLSCAEFVGSTKVRGISFDQTCIELMFADQQTESITKSGLAFA